MQLTKEMLGIDTRKKLLYLDQGFFSLASKERRHSWVDQAMDRITELLDLKLLAVPYSFSHVAEADLCKQRDHLVRFMQRISRGHDFWPYYKVEETQFAKAYQAFLAGKPPAYIREENDAISRSVHEWEGDYIVTVFTREQGFDRKRASKQQAVDALLDVLDKWAAADRTFEQDMELEFQDGARIYGDEYAKKAARLLHGDLAALIDSPISAGLVETLVSVTLALKADPKEIGAFLRSQHFKEMPAQQLSARLFSAFKERLRTKADLLPASREDREKKYSGLTFDVEHAATYAPYCDGFFADKAMAALMKSKRVAVEETYGCKVFSASDTDALFQWLSDIKAGMTPEHKEALRWHSPKHLVPVSSN